MQDTVQRAQPEGVPPLELTGERTLPDVPAENYWFRRHLAVYEWVAERCQGRDVVDMACGEGYGVDVLARRARARSRASTPTPRPTSTRGSSTRVRACASCATWWRATRSPATPSCSCRRSSTWPIRRPCCATSASMLRPGGTAYVSTPNLLTLAPPGAEKSDNPWHLKEYRAEEFRALCESVFGRGRAARPVPRARAAGARAGPAGGLGPGARRARHNASPSTTASRPPSPPGTSRSGQAPLERALDFVAALRP